MFSFYFVSLPLHLPPILTAPTVPLHLQLFFFLFPSPNDARQPTQVRFSIITISSILMDMSHPSALIIVVPNLSFNPIIISSVFSLSELENGGLAHSPPFPFPFITITSTSYKHLTSIFPFFSWTHPPYFLLITKSQFCHSPFFERIIEGCIVFLLLMTFSFCTKFSNQIFWVVPKIQNFQFALLDKVPP